ncbi:MAG: hypothetical protein NZ551_05880 [Microscillaceae bacterium]|nr:hypothetical protein [Microscillaceae bacterium]MDW8460722.1 hypothetical protein [Cytophagales bacterium]
MKKAVSYCFLLLALLAKVAITQAQNYQTWEGQGIQFLAPNGFSKVSADTERFEGKVEASNILHFGVYALSQSVNSSNIATSFKTLAEEAGLKYAGTQNWAMGNLKGMYAQGTVSNVPAYFAVVYDDSGSTKFTALIVHNNPAMAMAMLNSFRKK